MPKFRKTRRSHSERKNLHAHDGGVQLDFFIHLRKDGTPRKPKGCKPIYTPEEAMERRRARDRETKRKLRAADPEKYAAQVTEWVEKQKGTPRFKKKQRLSTKMWRQKNPERAAAAQAVTDAKRRRNGKNATPPWVKKEDLRAVWLLARKLTAETGVPHEVDHIIPLLHPHVSGLNVPWNLRAIPKKENRDKRNKLIPQMAVAVGAAPVKFYSDWDLMEFLRAGDALHLLDQ